MCLRTGITLKKNHNKIFKTLLITISKLILNEIIVETL